MHKDLASSTCTTTMIEASDLSLALHYCNAIHAATRTPYHDEAEYRLSLGAKPH